MDSVDKTRAQIIDYLKKICGGSPQPSDSLAMIGVDSVAMAELTFELEKKFGIKIDDDVLDVDTIEELTQYVLSKRAVGTERPQ